MLLQKLAALTSVALFSQVNSISDDEQQNVYDYFLSESDPSFMTSQNPNIHGNFPETFAIGATTSDYQHEGERSHDRTPSSWDRFINAEENGWMQQKTGELDNSWNDTTFSADMFHKGRDIVIPMAGDMGMKYFKFSISWSRLFEVKNQESSLKIYEEWIDKIISEGMTPVVTLLDSDFPESVDFESFAIAHTTNASL